MGAALVETIRAVCFDGADAFVEFERLYGIVDCKPRYGADLIWGALRRLDVRIALRANWPRALDENVLSCVPGIPDGYFAGEIFRTASNRSAWPIICDTLAISGRHVLFLVGDENRLAGGACVDFPQVMRLSTFLDMIEHARLGDPQKSMSGGAISALLEAIRCVVASGSAAPSSRQSPRISCPADKHWIGFRKARQNAVQSRRWARPYSRRPARLVR